MKTATNLPQDKPVAVWLLICCALIFMTVVLGGVTRLTRSGLSIVEWEPILGAIPPVTQSQWDSAFEKYKQTPEYQKVNFGMSLGEFKGIYYMEWGHRQLGRLIGVVFLFPFLYFLIRRRIARTLTPKLITIFMLGGLQGALGWYMVTSGLVDIPRVSPYRLTAHLALAVVIYGYTFWTALGLLHPRESTTPPSGLRRFGIFVTALIFLMILSGGFVAGNKAGFAFNTFPLMNGRFIPEGLFSLRPVWSNLFENIATVQFTHRLSAYGLCLVIPMFWWMAMRQSLPRPVRLTFHVLLGCLAIQVVLGITTLLYWVPVPLAAAHQAGALVLFSLALLSLHLLRARA
jgi:cytochrome c oxidase assembly protein subunit 15